MPPQAGLFILKYLLVLSKRGLIPRNISKIIKLPPCVACLFGKLHKRSWREKSKHSGGSIRNPSETRPMTMTSIDQVVSSQPGIIPQVAWDLTHSRFCAAAIFVDH